MQITSEKVQMYARVVIYWAAGFLVSHGVVSQDATWLEPALGGLLTLVNFVWTIYGNRLTARLNELAKYESVVQVKVADPAVAAAVPSTKVQTQ